MLELSVDLETIQKELVSQINVKEELFQDPLFMEIWNNIDYICPKLYEWDIITEKLVIRFVGTHSDYYQYVGQPYWLVANIIGLPMPCEYDTPDFRKKLEWVETLVWAKQKGHENEKFLTGFDVYPSHSDKNKQAYFDAACDYLEDSIQEEATRQMQLIVEIEKMRKEFKRRLGRKKNTEKMMSCISLGRS